MAISCAVLNCSNRSGRNSQELFRLPGIITTQGDITREKSERRRRLWLAAINCTATQTAIDHIRVCSDHFTSGKPSSLHEDTTSDWIPWANMGIGKKVPAKHTGETHRRLRNQKENTKKKDGADMKLSDGVNPDVAGPLQSSELEQDTTEVSRLSKRHKPARRGYRMEDGDNSGVKQEALDEDFEDPPPASARETAEGHQDDGKFIGSSELLESSVVKLEEFRIVPNSDYYVNPLEDGEGGRDIEAAKHSRDLNSITTTDTKLVIKEEAVENVFELSCNIPNSQDDSFEINCLPENDDEASKYDDDDHVAGRTPVNGFVEVQNSSPVGLCVKDENPNDGFVISRGCSEQNSEDDSYTFVKEERNDDDEPMDNVFNGPDNQDDEDETVTFEKTVEDLAKSRFDVYVDRDPNNDCNAPTENDSVLMVLDPRADKDNDSTAYVKFNCTQPRSTEKQHHNSNMVARYAIINPESSEMVGIKSVNPKKCLICKKEFQYEFHKMYHMQQVHPEYLEKDRRITDVLKPRPSTGVNFRGRYFKGCFFCRKQTYTHPYYLNLHMQQKHADCLINSSTIENMPSMQLEGLDSATPFDHNGKKVCPVCQQAFTYAFQLKYHIQKEHAEILVDDARVDEIESEAESMAKTTTDLYRNQKVPVKPTVSTSDVGGVKLTHTCKDPINIKKGMDQQDKFVKETMVADRHDFSTEVNKEMDSDCMEFRDEDFASVERSKRSGPTTRGILSCLLRDSVVKKTQRRFSNIREGRSELVSKRPKNTDEDELLIPRLVKRPTGRPRKHLKCSTPDTKDDFLDEPSFRFHVVESSNNGYVPIQAVGNIIEENGSGVDATGFKEETEHAIEDGVESCAVPSSSHSVGEEMSEDTSYSSVDSEAKGSGLSTNGKECIDGELTLTDIDHEHTSETLESRLATNSRTKSTKNNKKRTNMMPTTFWPKKVRQVKKRKPIVWKDDKNTDTSKTELDTKSIYCGQCGKLFVNIFLFRKHESVCKSSLLEPVSARGYYPCKKCDKVFSYVVEKQVHVLTDHTGEYHTCSVCGKPFAYQNSLKKHMIVHANEAVRKTNSALNDPDPSVVRNSEDPDSYLVNCMAILPKTEGLQIENGGVEISFPFENRKKSIDTATALPDVLSSSESSTLLPDNDDISAAEANVGNPDVNSTLKQHLLSLPSTSVHPMANRTVDKYAHSKPHTKLYPCKSCEVMFPELALLYLHELQKHPKHMCPYCSKIFAYDGLLQKHLLCHMDQEKHTCLWCGKKFLLLSTFTNHILQHNGINSNHRLSCNRCNTAWFDDDGILPKAVRRTIVRHLKQCMSVGGQDVDDIPKTSWTNTNGPKHKCQRCLKCQRCYILKHAHSRSVKMRHILRCKMCHQQFPDLKELKNDLHQHHNEAEEIVSSYSADRSFNCDFCSETFRCLFAFMCHKRTFHAGSEASEEPS